MRVVQCPVCERRYRFDASKMVKDRIVVRCRKCENNFAISREVQPAHGTQAPQPRLLQEAPSAAPENRTPWALIVKSAPGKTAQFRMATKLMPFTGERLSVLTQKLSRTPVRFHVELTLAESEALLKSIEACGAKAELSDMSAGGPRKKWTGVGLTPGKWQRWVVAAVLAVLLGGAGGMAYFLHSEVQKTKALELRGIDSLIPGEALFYIRFEDLEGNLRKIQENPTNKGLRSLFETLRSTRPVQEILSQQQAWESSLRIPFLSFNLMDLVGSDARLALYASPESDSPQFLVSLKGTLRIKLAETLRKLLPFGRKRPSRRRLDDGQIVYAVRPQGMEREVYYFSEGLIYVASTSPDVIKTSASLVKGHLPEKGSLKSISMLSRKSERVRINKLALFYMGIQNLIKSSLNSALAVAGAPLMKSLAAYGDLVGTISYGKGLVVESTMRVNPEDLDEPMRALLRSRPAPNRTLAYVPTNTILYACNKTMDLVRYVSWFTKTSNKDARFSDGIQQMFSNIRAETGLDMERDVLPLLGGEIAYAIAETNEKGGFAAPAMNLFLEVRDRPKTEASLDKLLKSPTVHSWLDKVGLDLARTSYQGVPIHTLRFQGNNTMHRFLLSPASPCYALVDDFFVIGLRLENLQQTVDLSLKQAVPLIKDRRFIEMKRLFKEKNHGMAYVDLKATSRLLRKWMREGPLAAAALIEADGGEARDLQTVLQVLETLNYARYETEFDEDHVRFLLYVAL